MGFDLTSSNRVEEGWSFLCKHSARINRDYWLVVSEERPHQWTVQLWGPVPLSHDGMHHSAEDVEVAAIDMARKHFESNRLSVDMPEKLTWALAMEAQQRIDPLPQHRAS